MKKRLKFFIKEICMKRSIVALFLSFVALFGTASSLQAADRGSFGYAVIDGIGTLPPFVTGRVPLRKYAQKNMFFNKEHHFFKIKRSGRYFSEMFVKAVSIENDTIVKLLLFVNNCPKLVTTIAPALLDLTIIIPTPSTTYFSQVQNTILHLKKGDDVYLELEVQATVPSPTITYGTTPKDRVAYLYLEKIGD
jgi:hypothetical protein